MASEMDVDDSPAPGAGNDGNATQANSKQMQEKIIKMHPLALIGISDHSTRVITGGTAQPTNSVIMGLLFGVQNHLTISIIDAEEVEYNHNKQHVDTKIQLHQKVFPTHEVVGWYRVFRSDMNGKEEEMGLPTPEDMMINNGWMKEYNESPLFVLMSSGEKEEAELLAAEAAEKEDKQKAQKPSADFDMDVDDREARDKMDRDEQLPLSIYETLVIAEQKEQQPVRSGAIFVNLEFELETFEPERIAVEQVFKTQPTTNSTVVPITKATVSSSSAGANDPPKMGPPRPPSLSEDKSSAKKEEDEEDALHPPPLSASSLHIQSLQSSIEAMNARIAVLLEFLRKTQSGKIPPDHALLRQVGSLVRQLPFVVGRGDFAVTGSRQMRDSRIAQEFEDGYDDMLLLSFLASVAKTTKAVLNYSDKFRIANDSHKNRDLSLRKLL